MPRTYTRRLEARRYKDYSEETVEAALKKVVDEGWSLRRASAENKISLGTLNNKYHGRSFNKNGGQTVFSDKEYFAPRKDQIENGKFVLVKVLGGLRKKTIYRYIGIVQGVASQERGDEIELQGLKTIEKERKTFVVEEGDEFVADMSDILAILPSSSASDVDGKVVYSFEKEIDVYEMK